MPPPLIDLLLWLLLLHLVLQTLALLHPILDWLRRSSAVVERIRPRFGPRRVVEDEGELPPKPPTRSEVRARVKERRPDLTGRDLDAAVEHLYRAARGLGVRGRLREGE